jgi:hypothetical protein
MQEVLDHTVRLEHICAVEIKGREKNARVHIWVVPGV